ncbi:hypothetical protein F5Y17DRAFT_459330 [Xylariaceae sp. FL0594]|nr:hypothetical protein F5Y17DRAFT_459330 [Xylariaceae sp. FL0594]
MSSQPHPSGHGLDDEAIHEAHDMIHHAEQEEHEHEAAAKRGLSDSAAEAEYDLIHHAEEELEQKQQGYLQVMKEDPLQRLRPHEQMYEYEYDIEGRL